MSTTSSSRPQLRRKSEIAISTCVRNGSSAFEFSNCLTIFGTTNVSSIATIETQTTNSSTG